MHRPPVGAGGEAQRADPGGCSGGEGAHEQAGVCVYVAGSLHCAAEANTTL